MAKKSSSSSQNENSLIDLADGALKEISKYAQSEKEEDKLIGYNVILTFLVLTFLMAGFLLPGTADIFSSIIYLFVSGIFAAILSYGYLRIIEIITNLSSKNYFALKISITLLFFVVSLSLIGFLYHIKELLNGGFALLIVQILVLTGLGYYKYPIRGPNNQEYKKETDHWALVGKVSDVCGIINFVVWIGAILLKAIGR
ncbi:MAG: hypothetical protein ABSB80_09750 [Methanoregula sp.]|jgi:hypothetical protein|uniref:hypothetical protein n=1 Tax=Methanoregula sp. TaxID=2052170 RepID=UPI003D14BB9B